MKKTGIFITGLACVALLASCAGNNGSPTSAEESPATASAISSTGTSAEDTPSDAAATGKVVYGEISEVIGNAVIIKEVEQPQIMSGGALFEFEEGATEFTLPNGTVIPIGEDGQPDFSGIEMPEGMTFNRGEMGEGGGFRMRQGEDGEGAGAGEGVERATFGEGGEGGARTAPADGGMMPSGDFTAGGAFTGDPAAGDGQQRRTIERAYTGEEIELIIPVGIPILTRTRGENGIEEKEIAMTNLKAGSMITVTYKEDDKNIESIYVTEASSGIMGGGMMGGDAVFFFDGGNSAGSSVAAPYVTITNINP